MNPSHPRRPVLFLLLAACLCAGATLRLSAEPEAIYTETFEAFGDKGVPLQWQYQAREGRPVAAASDEATEGASSQKVSFDERATACLLTPFITVEPGATYRLSFQARAEGRFTFMVRPLAFPSSKWEKPAELEKVLVRRPDWQEYTLTFTVPEGLHAVMIQAWIVGQSGSAFLDNLVLTRQAGS